MISNSLNSIMNERNISIRDLEGMTELPYMTIRSYVKGIRIPSLYNANIIAKALKIKVDKLIDEEYR